MDRLLVAAVIVSIAVVVALLVERRRPDAPTQATWTVPSQLDRREFARPDVAWLVAVFTSATCDSCRDTVAKAQVLAGNEVVVEEVEIGASPDRHRRYAIDAVPTLVLADADGVVQASFVGPVVAAELWAAVARAREGAPEGDA